MPLLKKKPYEKADLPKDLRDDEHVFYCEVTHEIFRDYEEYSERMFLYNSMVWTCCMTGKSNLTYTEALESEENAKKTLKEFPVELRIPILYVASKTKRTSFAEMADDVFLYAKDRYFIGENLETSFTGNKWKESHVLQVIAPPGDIKIKPSPKNGNNTEKHFFPPSNLFKYEIEHLDADDEDISEIMIVDCNQIRRKKGSYSREKNKLFIKQYVEQNERGVFIIKPSVMDDFGLNKMKFDQIFDGPLPNFDASKKLDKPINGKRVAKQETLAKYLTKVNATGMVQNENKNKINLLEQMKKREEEHKLKQQLKEEEIKEIRRRKKAESTRLSNFMKAWYKPKEDLILEDQKVLPIPTPVKSKVPEKYVGDMLMILEFVNSFSKLLSTKDFFPGGFTLEIMERALLEKEVAGPLTDIIQMLLTAIFNALDEESSQYNTNIEVVKEIKDTRSGSDMTHLGLRDGSYLATLASMWVHRYQGLPLSKLPLYSLTVSEVLRLHLLSSGARINENGARWRYQERGGYTSEDDPGLYLRIHQSHILKALAVHNVVQLPLGDKLKVVSCLMNQLLTFADIRDVIEERLDKSRQCKLEMKMTQLSEKKRQQEHGAARFKLKKEGKADRKLLAENLEKLATEGAKKKLENEKKIEKLMIASCEKQVVMGLDRAYRKYLKLESVPGVFVSNEEENCGICLSEPTKQNLELVNADRTETVKYLKKVFLAMNSSDKENEPSSSPKKLNGILNSLSSPGKDETNKLLMCSADPETCIVHSTTIERTRWAFFYEEHELDQLISNLSKRGIRESELQQVIKYDKDLLVKMMMNTPVTQLNPDVQMEEREQKPNKPVKKSAKDRYEDANLGFPLDMRPEEVLHNTLIDNILEMEEKIYAGNLGELLIKNRDEWRECLAKRKYDELDKTIVKRETNKPQKIVVKTENSDKDSRDGTPEVQENEAVDVLQEDPGKFLGATIDIESEDSETDDNEILLGQSRELAYAVQCCAIALVQVGYAVDPKYLKKPLGRADVSKYDRITKDYFDKWEQVLLASTSFSQVFLHYGTLDSCVMWSRSALLARCRVCRRQKDSENMLLCDSCNLGHHLYCLKPKLTAVPTGDWFCNRCLQEKAKQEKLLRPEPKPAKKRRIFRDEDVEEEEMIAAPSEIEEPVEDEENSDDEEPVEVVENGVIKVEVCKTCGSGGELIACETCTSSYHIECVQPPLRRAPRGSWLCNSCKDAKEKKEKQDSDYFKYTGRVVQRTGIFNHQRRCASLARHNIHNFAKYLRGISDSDDSGDEVVNKRSHRREEGRDDLPLHNVALQELLADVMKHRDAWPFIRPVQKNEVPDYYEVITRPMDFGTIKYKLNMGEYSEDCQLMMDVALIFENCNTYNHTDDDVYKCGERLLKHLKKKSKELGLKIPKTMLDDEEIEPPKSKKRRAK